MPPVEADAQVAAWMEMEARSGGLTSRKYLYNLLRWATEPQTRCFGRMVAWGPNAALVVADDKSIHRLQYDWLKAHD